MDCPPPLTLIFETHAASTDNERRIASGWLDPDLSALGRAQAAELGARYRDKDVHVVLSSDLRRSYRTAEIAFAGRSVPIVRDPRLRECDYGSWTGRPAAEVEAERVRRIIEPFPGGESYVQAAARIKSALHDLRRDYVGGGKIIIIGHRATWYSLEHLLRGREFVDIISAPWHWRPGWVYSLQAADWTSGDSGPHLGKIHPTERDG